MNHDIFLHFRFVRSQVSLPVCNLFTCQFELIVPAVRFLIDCNGKTMHFSRSIRKVNLFLKNIRSLSYGNVKQFLSGLYRLRNNDGTEFPVTAEGKGTGSLGFPHRSHLSGSQVDLCTSCGILYQDRLLQTVPFILRETVSHLQGN